MKAPALPQPAQKRTAPVPGVEHGDFVYVNHERHGPMVVRVLAHGRAGLTGECDKKERHAVTWDRFLGHKTRMLHRYNVVDQGADGALVEDARGRRRYLAGQLPAPDGEGTSDTGKAAAKPKQGDDPLLDGMDRLKKSAGLPDDAVVLFAKGGPIANRAGLALKDVTDSAGHRTKRWVKTMPDQHRPREPGKSDDSAHGAPMKHGDVVQFRHGDVGGQGKIVASGKDGVTLQDDDGEHHHVRHEHLVKPGAGEGGDTGNATVPPDKFSAHSYAAEHNDPNVTPADILKSFPPDTAGKIAAVNAKLEKSVQTIDQFKKDGNWSPERAAVHQKIIDHILSDEAVAAATPAEGEKPSFTLLGGRGGSGKSWFKGKAYDPAKCIVLDADEIKKALPEYEGWNAAMLHEESGEIFDKITDTAMSMGLQIVHDATMKTAKKAVALVNRFKEGGYRTAAHYMYLPPQEAAKRGVERFLGPTKRFVPPGIILGNTTNEGSFDQVKGLVDAWSFRDNNVGKGQEPKLLSEYGDEADGRESGRHGLPADQPRHGDRTVAAPPGAGGEAGGGKGQLAKAGGVGSLGDRRVIFLKAAIPGGAAADLFAVPVQVHAHVRAGHTVAPYIGTRKKAAPKPPMGDEEAARVAAEVFAHQAKRPKGTSSSYAGMIGAWAFNTGRKVSDSDETVILRKMQEHVDKAKSEIGHPGYVPALDPLLAGLPSSSRFQDGKGELGRGKWRVVWPDYDSFGTNLHLTKEAAAAEARQWYATKESDKKRMAADAQRDKEIADKVSRGEEITDSDLKHLNLHTGGRASEFAWLSPVVQRLFGIQRNRVREAMGDALREGTKGFSNSKVTIGDPRKALVNAAKFAGKYDA